MSEKTLFDLLNSLGLGVAYDHFRAQTEPPFLLYRLTDTTPFLADDSNFMDFNSYIVDLVTEYKSPDLEAQLEALFRSNHIIYSKTEDYIENERIYQIRYFIN